MDQETPQNAPEPGQLVFLRRLVTTLTAVMILGVVTIIVLLVIRLNQPGTPAISTLPDQITLPAGEVALSFTQGRGWFAVVTDADRIHIFDAATGALRQSVEIEN